MLALPHQRKMVTRIIEGAGAEAITAKVAPGDSVVTALGGVTPSGVPVPDEVWRPIARGPPARPRRRAPGGPARRPAPRRRWRSAPRSGRSGGRGGRMGA